MKKRQRHSPFGNLIRLFGVLLLLHIPAGCSNVLWNSEGNMNSTQRTERGEYVILVHGIGRTKYSMHKTERFLKQQGYHVLNFNYPSTRYAIGELSEQYLKPFVMRQCIEPAKPIHFVTHSMGGILVRFYLKDHASEQVGRVVMLAPPNQGSELTDWLKGWFFYKWLLGPAGQELGTDNTSIPARLGPVNFELGIIAGDRSINWLNSLRIPGADDGKVSVEHTKAPGMKDFVLVHTNHTFMMRDATVLQQIDHFLRTGRFRRDLNA
jgi:triacylglycerol lipase